MMSAVIAQKSKLITNVYLAFLQVVFKGSPGQDAYDSFVLMMDNGAKVEVPCHALQPRSQVRFGISFALHLLSSMCPVCTKV